MPSTDIATRTDQPAAPTGAEQSALVLWAYEAQQAARVATSLAKTSFVPASLRGKPEDITAAILAGQELGLQPMASLRSMDVIQGTPALRAHAMRGLVQSHGHKVWIGDKSPTRVVMHGQRRGPDGLEEEQEVEWTLERAEQLGLTGKGEWKKQPQTMLTARATGEICRLVAADVLYAMPYASEELDGDGPAPAVRVAGGRVTAAEITGEPAAAPTEQPQLSTDEPADSWPETAQPGSAEAGDA